MNSDAVESLTFDDIDAAFRSVAGNHPTNPANERYRTVVA